MNKKLNLYFALFAICASSVLAQEQPLLHLRVRSLDSLSEASKRVNGAIGLPPDLDPAQHLGGALGSPVLAGVDRGRAWQFTLVFKGMAAPARLALFVPVTDYGAFTGGLNAEGPLGQADKIQADRYAILLLKQPNSTALSADETALFKAWVPGQLGTERVIEVVLHPDENARQAAMQILAIGRQQVTTQIGNQPSPPGSPINTQVLAQIIGLYFDVFETVAKGLQRLELGIGLSNQSLTISKAVQVLPGSDIANWLKGGGAGLGNLAAYLDPQASVAFAASISEKPAYMDLIKKLSRLGFQMQNMDAGGKLVEQVDGLIDTLTPMRFAGSVSIGKGFFFSGLYEFPGRDTAAVYGTFKKFFTEAMPSMTGGDKMYATAEFKENVRRVGDTQVDRFSMTINTNSPLFQMPGQKESLELMWPGGRLEFEYAVKGNRLYAGDTAAMTKLLSGPPPAAPAAVVAASENATVYGTMNMMALLKQTLGVNPMLPPAIREAAGKIDPNGTQITFSAKLDGGVTSRAEVPLRVLEEFGKFQRAVEGQ